MRTALSFVLIAALASVGIAQAEEVYKWKDGNRVTTYSQLPPAQGVPTQRLRTTPYEARAAGGSGSARAATANSAATPAGGTPAPAGSADAARAQPSAAQEALRAKLDAEEKTRLAQLAQQRQSQCQSARAQFDQLTQYARMRVQDDTGKIRVMPEEERQQHIQEAKARIIEFCAS